MDVQRWGKLTSGSGEAPGLGEPRASRERPSYLWGRRYGGDTESPLSRGGSYPPRRGRPRLGPRRSSGGLGRPGLRAGARPRPSAAEGPPRANPSAAGATARRGPVQRRDPGLGPGRTRCSGPPSPPGALWRRLVRRGRRSLGEGRGGEEGVSEAPEPSRAGEAGGEEEEPDGLAGGRVAAAAAAWRSQAGPRRGPRFGSPSRPPRTRRKL